MATAAIKHMASNFAKLDKFEGVDFGRWQKKMHFLLSSMSVVYVLTTPMPDDGGDNPTMEQVRKRAKWDNDDYVCRGLILNGGKASNKANASGTNGLVDGSTNSLRGHNMFNKFLQNDSILCHARMDHVHFKRMQDMSKDGAFDMDTVQRIENKAKTILGLGMECQYEDRWRLVGTRFGDRCFQKATWQAMVGGSGHLLAVT
ncbi:hypothetical protein Tco_0468744 [Tanacetum coccineum]